MNINWINRSIFFFITFAIVACHSIQNKKSSTSAIWVKNETKEPVLPVDFYVSPTGADTNPGTAEKPFATLERARNAARSKGNSTIALMEGTYRLTKTFELDQRDSRTIYKAAKGAKPRLVGSVSIPASAIRPVTDKTTLDRLYPEMRDKVKEVDLYALGITDFGSIGPHGFRRPYIAAPLELFADDEPMPLASAKRSMKVGEVLDRGPVTRDGQKPDRGGMFKFDSDMPLRWTRADDIWITGNFSQPWTDNTVKIKSIDLEKKVITTIQPDMYGFRSGKVFSILNLLEEIDEPGEFMVDKKSGKLYFLPPADKNLTECRFEVTVMEEPLVAIEGATGVVFDGVDIECSRGMGVYIERGSNNRIQNATLRNLGMLAVCIGKGIAPDPDYRSAFTGTPVSRTLGSWHEHIYDNPTFNREAGTGQGVVNCHIYNIGAGGISLGGGDRKSLVPAGNFVENCHIHHFNRWDRTYRGAVNIDGVGNRISHCLFNDAPGLAIYLHGNEHVIEYNEIHHVMEKSDDMGAFYMGRDPSEYGNVIRYNYWHDLAQGGQAFCLYFDDMGGNGTTVHGNVFRNAGSAYSVFINRGRDFTATNNVFIDCSSIPIALSALPKDKARDGYLKEKNEIFKRNFEILNYQKAPWSIRYPRLKKYDFTRAGLGSYVVSERNLFVNCHRKPSVSYELTPLAHFKSRTLAGSEGIFIDQANGNYAIDHGMDIGIEGWETIPFEKMGLIKK